ncbi:transcriptional regulator [Pseudomonas cavernicola]|uniref:Transcriptional regulator n=1 Tax=Pseudomonas cavernicola TaxID=2320866 RepID=A0A418XLQ4_9PSED|nr:helix-turn-helix transcriptional regulator [Pseudomonas cavernicola]RJG13366.1 transcriptional regulator [Pseudomonas cavernicola]
MDYAPNISLIASLLADPGRAAIIWALMDGTSRPAGELAILADLSPSSASGHLARLTEGGVLTLEARGRSRYYRIAAAEIGAAVEALVSASQASQTQRARAIPTSRSTPLPLRHARTCYDHLAGELAVAVYERMLGAGWIVQDGKRVELTASGASGLAELGIDVQAESKRRRQFACACPDWSERKPHLGGALGAALLQACVQLRWLRAMKDSRALHVSPSGSREIPRIAAQVSR